MSQESKRDGLTIRRPFIKLEKQILRQYVENAEFESSSKIRAIRSIIRQKLYSKCFVSGYRGSLAEIHEFCSWYFDEVWTIKRACYGTYSRGLQRNPCIRTAQAAPAKADLVKELHRVPRGFEVTWSALREFVRQIDEAGRGELRISEQIELRLWRSIIYAENNASQYEQTIPMLVLDCREDSPCGFRQVSWNYLVAKARMLWL